MEYANVHGTGLRMDGLEGVPSSGERMAYIMLNSVGLCIAKIRGGHLRSVFVEVIIHVQVYHYVMLSRCLLD